jgi:predicted regulator of Ras-like GTPase activity (Roadblock/LC7/MglB family)
MGKTMSTVLANRLKELVEQIPGAQAVVLVDQDGLTVESYRRPDSDVDSESLSAECNNVVTRARDAASRLDFGAVGELLLSTEQYFLLCCFVRGEYYLILVMSRSAVLGRGRFFLQRMAFSLRSEI